MTTFRIQALSPLQAAHVGLPVPLLVPAGTRCLGLSARGELVFQYSQSEGRELLQVLQVALGDELPEGQEAFADHFVGVFEHPTAQRCAVFVSPACPCFPTTPAALGAVPAFEATDKPADAQRSREVGELDDIMRRGLRVLAFLSEIARERGRQISEERFTPEVDDMLRDGDLAMAAAAYAASAAGATGLILRQLWPWSDRFKRKDRHRDLIRAAALILAQLEADARTVDRAAGKAAS